jgi:ABC-type multidrug transport system ATPase subunit
METVIRARSLTKQFGQEVAVRDLTFEIPSGVIFGFIGPSGSGKTTTIRMLTGVYAPTAGELTVLDRPPSQFTRRHREKIGYMAQHFNLFPNLTLGEP